MIGYFRVSFLLSGIFGYFGYFRVCPVFSGISGFTHIIIYFLTSILGRKDCNKFIRVPRAVMGGTRLKSELVLDHLSASQFILGH